MMNWMSSIEIAAGNSSYFYEVWRSLVAGQADRPYQCHAFVQGELHQSVHIRLLEKRSSRAARWPMPTANSILNVFGDTSFSVCGALMCRSPIKSGCWQQACSVTVANHATLHECTFKQAVCNLLLPLCRQRYSPPPVVAPHTSIKLAASQLNGL